MEEVFMRSLRRFTFGLLALLFVGCGGSGSSVDQQVFQELTGWWLTNAFSAGPGLYNRFYFFEGGFSVSEYTGDSFQTSCRATQTFTFVQEHLKPETESDPFFDGKIYGFRLSFLTEGFLDGNSCTSFAPIGDSELIDFYAINYDKLPDQAKTLVGPKPASLYETRAINVQAGYGLPFYPCGSVDANQSNPCNLPRNHPAPTKP